MKKGTLCLWAGIIGTVLGMSWGINANGREDVAGMGALLFLASLFVLLPIGIFRRVKAKRDARKNCDSPHREWEPIETDANEMEQRTKTQTELIAQMEALEEQIPQPKSGFDDWLEKQRAANTIVSTAIVDTTMKSKTKASATSSVVRGAVGGALFGPVGMVAGAVTPKKKTVTKAKTVTFSVRYANGDCKLETVKVGSARFKELAKYIA